jgi:hypothetical protein
VLLTTEPFTIIWTEARPAASVAVKVIVWVVLYEPLAGPVIVREGAAVDHTNVIVSAAVLPALSVAASRST